MTCNGGRSEDPFDYAAGRANLQKKQAELQARRLALWQRAHADAQKIIDMIVSRYAPQRIIQWGSLLQPQHFSEASDIDLAVAGVDPVTFLQLLGDAEDLTEFSLDLLRWEDLPSAYQEIILSKGQVVYVQNEAVASCGGDSPKQGCA